MRLLCVVLLSHAVHVFPVLSHTQAFVLLAANPLSVKRE